MENKVYSIDGILWLVWKESGLAQPICPTCRIKLSPFSEYNSYIPIDESCIWELKCDSCNKRFKLKRALSKEERYAAEKVLAMERKNYEVIDVDGMLTPVTKKVKFDSNSDYFCTAQVRDSKRGPQLVVYAGKKGQAEKSQIFVTPEERRLSFDQKDINPADIFTKITAEFNDGTVHEIRKKKSDDK